MNQDSLHAGVMTRGEFQPHFWRLDAPSEINIRYQQARTRRKSGTHLKAWGLLMVGIGVITALSGGAYLLFGLAFLAVGIAIWALSRPVSARAEDDLADLQIHRVPQSQAVEVESKVCAAANEWVATATHGVREQHSVTISSHVRRAMLAHDAFDQATTEGQRKAALDTMYQVLAQLRVLNERNRKGVALVRQHTMEDAEAARLHVRRAEVASMEAVTEVCRNEYRQRLDALRDLGGSGGLPTTADLEAPLAPELTGDSLLPGDVAGVVRRVLTDRNAPGTAADRQHAYRVARRLNAYGIALALLRDGLIDLQSPLEFDFDPRALREVLSHERLSQEAVEELRHVYNAL